MFFGTNYVEVYSTLKMEDFFKAKNILSENKIVFKDTSINNQLRLAFNNTRGDNVILSRQGSTGTLYRLSVKKNEEIRARQILCGISK